MREPLEALTSNMNTNIGSGNCGEEDYQNIWTNMIINRCVYIKFCNKVCMSLNRRILSNRIKYTGKASISYFKPVSAGKD